MAELFAIKKRLLEENEEVSEPPSKEENLVRLIG